MYLKLNGAFTLKSILPIKRNLSPKFETASELIYFSKVHSFVIEEHYIIQSVFGAIWYKRQLNGNNFRPKNAASTVI